MIDLRTGYINGLMLALAFGAVGCKKVSPASSSSNYIGADHPVAKTISAALDSGEAFKPGFLLFDPGMAPTQAEAILIAIRNNFPQKPTFVFVEGLEIRRTGNLPVIFLLPSESVEHPSMFSLPAQTTHFIYTVFEAKNNKGAKDALHVLMWEKGGAWQAVRFDVYSKTIGKWDFNSAFASAQKEEQTGDLFVAACLYHTAQTLARSPAYRTSGQQHRLKPQFAKLAQRFQGKKSIETISVDGTDIDIRSIQVLSVANEGAYIGITRVVNTLDSPDVMTSLHKDIARVLLTKHPNLRKHYVGIGVLSKTQNAPGRNFKTFYSLGEL